MEVPSLILLQDKNSMKEIKWHFRAGRGDKQGFMWLKSWLDAGFSHILFTEISFEDHILDVHSGDWHVWTQGADSTGMIINQLLKALNGKWWNDVITEIKPVVLQTETAQTSELWGTTNLSTRVLLVLLVTAADATYSYIHRWQLLCCSVVQHAAVWRWPCQDAEDRIFGNAVCGTAWCV